MEEKILVRLTELIRMSGYLIASGALIGFSVGIYLLFNREDFSFFVGISSYEATSYFLAVFIPSFVILIIVGYLFATTFGLRKPDLLTVAPLCIFSIVSMVLSALSVFYLLSFLGGLLALTALVRAYTKPLFKRLYKSEAFFLVEAGAMFTASFSVLFLSMWLVSNFFLTYAMGFYGGYFPYALALVAVFSFLMFFAIPLWGSRGANAGVCGALGLSMTILSYLFAVQNRYAFFNAPSYIGFFMLVLGLISALVGDLLYIRLFFSEPAEPTAIQTSSILYEGRYCPHCGKPSVATSQNKCSHCGRSSMWTPYAPFCSSCGRLVPTNSETCPHCEEDIANKRTYFYLREAQEEILARKSIEESRKRKSWMKKGLQRISLVMRSLVRPLSNVLTLKETVFIIILTFLFCFISFIGYRRIELQAQVIDYRILLFNYGLPLEWLRIKYMLAPINFIYGIDILWIPLAFDVIFFFFASLGLVYGVTRLRRRLFW